MTRISGGIECPSIPFSQLPPYNLPPSTSQSTLIKHNTRSSRPIQNTRTPYSRTSTMNQQGNPAQGGQEDYLDKGSVTSFCSSTTCISLIPLPSTSTMRKLHAVQRWLVRQQQSPRTTIHPPFPIPFVHSTRPHHGITTSPPHRLPFPKPGKQQ